MSDYFDIHGQPMTMNEWASSRSEDPDSMWQQAARKTAVPEADAHVSTVWLGLDHSFSDDGPPIIFESMIFGGNLDQEQVRYPTMDEAHAGHEALVEKVKREAATFADLAADPMVRDCVAAIEKVLAEHRAAFDLSEYGNLYASLVTAVTSDA